MRFPTVINLALLCAISALAAPGSALAQKAQAAYAVHPLCVEKVVHMSDFRFQSGEDRLAVAACNRTFRRYAVTAPSRDWLFADEPPPDDDPDFFGPTGYFGYRVVGALNAKVTLVEVQWSGGGTGIFSALAFISGWPKGKPGRGTRLTTVGVVQGGDRCQGTLDDTKMLSPTRIRISWTITPDSFFSAGPYFAIRETAEGRYEIARLDDADRARADRLGSGLPGYPQDCIGHHTIEFDLANGTAQLAEVAVDTSDLPSESKHQQCFSRLIREAGSGPSIRFSAEQHLAFTQRFERECP
jgi:hypothetical protein